MSQSTNKEHIGDGAYVELTPEGICLSAQRDGGWDEVHIGYIEWQNLRDWMRRNNLEWK